MEKKGNTPMNQITYCTNCGRKNEDNDNFCINCGNSLNVMSQQNYRQNLNQNVRKNSTKKAWALGIGSVLISILTWFVLSFIMMVIVGLIGLGLCWGFFEIFA